jgi:predicted nucleic acid-binding protein
VILDTGFLISVDRGERAAQVFLSAALRNETPLATTHPVVAQVWRNGARQARLSTLLSSMVVYPLDDGAIVGNILARSNTADVVDAHLVDVAVRLGEPILTDDVKDIEALSASMPEPRPAVFPWP